MGKALTQETEIELLKAQVINIDKKMDEQDKRNCEQHEEIKGSVSEIKTLVSQALTNKADKAEVVTLTNEVNQLKTDSAVNAWKIGSITATLATAGSFIIKYLIDKL